MNEADRKQSLFAGLISVAQHLGDSIDPDDVMTTLGRELRHLDLDVMLLTLGKDEDASLYVRYTSIPKNRLTQLFSDLPDCAQEPRIPPERLPFYSDLIERRSARYMMQNVPDSAVIFPNPTSTELERFRHLCGIDDHTRLIFLPLATEAETLGLLVIWGPQLEADDLVLWQLFASHLTAVLTLAGILKTVYAEQVEEQTTLLKLSQLLLAQVSAEGALQQAVALAAQLLKADFAVINLLNPVTREFVPEVTVGWQADTLPATPWDEQGMANGLSHVTYTRAPVAISDESQETRFGTPQFILDTGITSTLIVPMIRQSEQVVGAFVVNNRERRDYSEGEVRLLSLIANTTAQAIERTQLLEHTQRQLDELSILHGVALAGTEELDEQSLIQRVALIVGRFLDAEALVIALADREAGRLRLFPIYRADHYALTQSLYPWKDSVPLHFGVAGQVIRTGRRVRIDDVSRLPVPEVGVLDNLSSLLCVPLRVGDHVVGVMQVESRRVDAFTDAEERLLTTVAGQLSVAVEKLQWLQAESRRRHEAEALRNAAASLTTSLDLDRVLSNILTYLKTVIPYYSATIFLDEDQGLLAVAARGLPDHSAVVNHYFPRDQSLYSIIQSTKRPLILPDASQDARYRGWAGTEYVRGWLGVPLMLQGEIIGYITIDSRDPDFFKPKDIQLAVPYANQAAVAIGNARLFKQTQAALAETQALYRTARSLSSTDSLAELLSNALENLAAALPANQTLVVRVDQDTHQITDHSSSGPLLLNPGWIYGDGFWNSPCGQVLRDREPLLSTRESVESGQASHDPGWPSDHKLGSIVIAPLLYRDQTLGLVAAVNACNQRDFAQRDMDLLTATANQIAAAIRNVQLIEELAAEKRRLELLYTLSQRLITSLDVRWVAESALNLILSAMGGVRADMFQLEPGTDRLCLFASTDADIRQRATTSPFLVIRIGTGLVGEAAAQQIPLIEPDVSQSRYWVEIPDLGGNVQSAVSIPLVSKESLLGVINLVSDQLDAYKAKDHPIFAAVAAPIVLAVQNALFFEEAQRHAQKMQTASLEKGRLLEAADRRASELSALFEMSAAIRVAESQADILNVVLSHSLALLKGEWGAIAMPGAEPDTLAIVHRCGWPAHNGDSIHSVNSSLLGHVFRTKEAHLTADLGEDMFPNPLVGERWPERRTAMFAPLQTQERTVGVITIGAAAERHFTNADLRLLTVTAEIAGSALQRAWVMDTLEQQVERRTYQLAQANARLQELDRLKSEFVSSVSHELRTPLTNIKLYLALLDRGKPERQRTYLSILHKEAEHLQQLIETVLDLSRLDMNQDGESAQMLLVDLSPLMQSVIDSCRPRAKDQGVTLTYAPPLNPVYVYGHSGQLSQAMVNLVGNAITYTGPGGRIEAAVELDKSEVRIVVADSGMGIPEQEQALLFERFFRGHLAIERGIPGTGLGLSIVKEIIHRHRGTIRVTSTLSKGSMFTLCLPAKRTEP